MRTGPHKNDDFSDIISAARTIYNNMVSAKEWNKVNPTDAKLLALTSKLEKLEKENVALAAAANPSGNQNNGNNKYNGNSNGQQSGKPAGSTEIAPGGLEKWCTIKKGDTIQHFGRTFYWCDKHIHPQGHWNGLYCTHRPEDHDQWKNQRNNCNRGRNNSQGNDGNSTKSEGNGKKLAINSCLREVLCFRLMLSDDDADAICKEIDQSN